MTSNRKEIIDLEKQLEQLEALRDVLGDAITDQKKAELKAQLSQRRGETQSRADSRKVPRTAPARAAEQEEADNRRQEVYGPQTRISDSELQGPVLSGEFPGSVDLSTKNYYGTPPIDAEQAEAIYREKIAERCGSLPLQSVDTSSAGINAEPLSLAQIYIELDTRQGTSALQAAISNPRLVLLGDPGSGKSTFVNYLTHVLAKGAWSCLPAWPKEERDALPIRVIMREFARWVAAKKPLPKASPKLLWDFIIHDLKEWRLGDAENVLKEALEKSVEKEIGGK